MHRYYLFHKPYQVMSQFSEAGEKKTLADFCKGLQKDVYPVGRLDYDSEGLLLLTNNKQLNTRLLDPKFGHERTYWVQVEGTITEEAIARLEHGVTISIDGKAHRTLPARAILLHKPPEVSERHPPIRYRANIPTSWVVLTLREGKNRQVRRMTVAVGYPTLRLIRYSIGAVTLDGIEVGECREVSEKIIPLLMKGRR